jgi:uncharacterized repeat protein (TIGR03803 family)
LTPSGQETFVHAFAGAPQDGEEANSEPVDVNGTLYGTTDIGGANNDGALYALAL